MAHRQGKPPRKDSGKRRPRGTTPLNTGARVATRALALPFAEGPVPEEIVESIDDLLLFCEGLGLELPEAAPARLARYAQRLFEANAVMNLFRGATTPEELAGRHLGDCLVFQACLATLGQGRVLDVGTGAGLPAVPLAIACPGLRVVALDSTAKKTAFVVAVKRELELDNLEVLTERAETLGHQKGHRGAYDAVVSRATANLPALLEITVPFLKPGGFLFASKGSRVAEEVEAAANAFRELKAELVSQETYGTMEPGVEFAMLVIRKAGDTPARYPRHPSQIKSRPLGRVEV